MSGWVAGAVVVGSVAGAAISAGGAEAAASQQASAAENSAAIQQQMFNQVVGREQPFVSAGQGSQDYLNYLLGIGPNPATAPVTPERGRSGVGPQAINAAPGPAGGPGFGSLLQPFTAANFQQLSPAYQFQLEQGKQGVLGGDASSAGALSGSAQKDLIGYNQNAANSAFNNAFNQYWTQTGNIYSRLAAIAQTGQAAASNQATGASAFGGNIGQQVAAVGAAQAGGTVGATNAIANTAGSLPWLTSLANQPQNWTPESALYNPNSNAALTLGGNAGVGVNPWTQ